MSSTVLRQLRLAGLLEGTSFLLLLGVAMPLKYMAGMPMAVRLVGLAHGLLFIVYVATIAQATRVVGWPLRRALVLLAAAVVPFGPFAMDRRLREEQGAAAKREAGAAG